MAVDGFPLHFLMEYCWLYIDTHTLLFLTTSGAQRRRSTEWTEASFRFDYNELDDPSNKRSKDQGMPPAKASNRP
jgi:hypothetical protein